VPGADLVEDVSERVSAPQIVVLETKLTKPRVRAEHVPRHDLLAVLRSGSSRLTLLAAPPGFGKTTLLAE
jgi:ATP/maltotriose-dependent transcriptional regulator MalT